jgi:23S rRNA (pseudouridine1915-N3)-methyltransferase
MPIRIISVGKKHETWIVDGVSRYQERLKAPFGIEWTLLPHSSLPSTKALQEESGRILNSVRDNDFVILLDERGKNISSPQLSDVLLSQLQNSRPVAIIIGGAYGVDSAVHERTNFTWSLSQLVFPHQLVRLMLCEQIYRAQEIAAGNPYHHE